MTGAKHHSLVLGGGEAMHGVSAGLRFWGEGGGGVSIVHAMIREEGREVGVGDETRPHGDGGMAGWEAWWEGED